MTERGLNEQQGFMEWLRTTVESQPKAVTAARDEESRLHLARALRRARLAAGMTQAQVAEVSGLKQAMISRLEKADHKPTFATVLKYVTALHGELVVACVARDWSLHAVADLVRDEIRGHTIEMQAWVRPTHDAEGDEGKTDS